MKPAVKPLGAEVGLLLRSLGLSLCLALWLAMCGLGSAHAHKGSDAYLDVQAAPRADGNQTLRLALSVAVKDLDLAVPVDADADGKVTWGEVKAATPALLALVNRHAQLSKPDTGACRLNWQFKGAERRSDGAYLQFSAEAVCLAAAAQGIDYTLFKTQDANHRLLMSGQMAGKDFLTVVSAHQGSGESSGASVGRWAALRDYFWLGAHHLLEGYDHLAFLLALVLPLQLRLRLNTGRGTPLTSPLPGANAAAPEPIHQRAVWMNLLRTVTAFTLGHSVTLVLASLGWTAASPQWVEPMIALSIAAAALLNLWPVKGLRTDVLALGFGMVHGYGFAGLLQEATAPQGLLPYALAGFNLGIEAGQLMAVAAWVVVSQAVVNQAWYHPLVVRRGSQLLTLLAVWWFWQRVA